MKLQESVFSMIQGDSMLHWRALNTVWWYSVMPEFLQSMIYGTICWMNSSFRVALLKVRTSLNSSNVPWSWEDQSNTIQTRGILCSQRVISTTSRRLKVNLRRVYQVMTFSRQIVNSAERTATSLMETVSVNLDSQICLAKQSKPNLNMKSPEKSKNRSAQKDKPSKLQPKRSSPLSVILRSSNEQSMRVLTKHSQTE